MKRLVVFLALAGCAHATRSRAPKNWLELETGHFVLRTDLPPDDARKAIADLEIVRNALLAAGWSSPQPSPAKIAVLAPAGQLELHEFLPYTQAGIAFHGPFGERTVVVDGKGDLGDSQTVKHEVTHALAYDLLVTNPSWVQEGLACYLETLQIDRSNGQATRGKPNPNRLDFLYFYRYIPRIDWSMHILGRPDAAHSLLDGYAFETLSWLLVHWLVDHDTERFNRFLGRLTRGDSMWAAFNGIYPELDEARLKSELNDLFHNQSRMRQATFPFEPWSGEIASRSLVGAEMHALRAELLLYGAGGRTPEFEKEIALAKAIDPGNPLAVALEGSDPGPAIQSHPDDWRAWMLWHQKNPSDIASIRKAAALAPDNAIVLASLALAEQKSGEKEAALRHGEQALKISRDFFEFDALAQIYDANGRCVDAEIAEQRAIDALGDHTEPSRLAIARERLMDIGSHCGRRDRSTASRRKIEVEPLLKSCRQPMVSDDARGVTSEFTIREDGTVTAVVIKGAKTQDVAGRLRRFIESCTFEPVLIDGHVRQLQATIDLRDFTH